MANTLSSPESLQGKDADLKIQSRADEKVLTISSLVSPEATRTDEVIKQSAQFFAPAGKIGAILGVVDTDQIVVSKQTELFRPYWRISAGYACRFIRVHDHTTVLETDIEYIHISGVKQTIGETESPPLDEILAAAGSNANVDYGPIRIDSQSLTPPESTSSPLGARTDAGVDRTEVTIPAILETARLAYTGRFVFDATLSTESKDTYEVLQKQTLYPITEENLRKRGTVLEPTFKKEDVVNEVRRLLAKKPTDNPHRIIEQEFLLSEVSLIYLPYIDYTLSYKGNTKQVRYDAATEKVREL
jgi:hypothetical protein